MRTEIRLWPQDGQTRSLVWAEMLLVGVIEFKTPSIVIGGANVWPNIVNLEYTRGIGFF